MNPEHIIRQLVTALEGSGTRLRSDQWYVEIEAVAAGKRYLAEQPALATYTCGACGVSMRMEQPAQSEENLYDLAVRADNGGQP